MKFILLAIVTIIMPQLYAQEQSCSQHIDNMFKTVSSEYRGNNFDSTYLLSCMSDRSFQKAMPIFGQRLWSKLPLPWDDFSSQVLVQGLNQVTDLYQNRKQPIYKNCADIASDENPLAGEALYALHHFYLERKKCENLKRYDANFSCNEDLNLEKEKNLNSYMQFLQLAKQDLSVAYESWEKDKSNKEQLESFQKTVNKYNLIGQMYFYRTPNLVPRINPIVKVEHNIQDKRHNLKLVLPIAYDAKLFGSNTNAAEKFFENFNTALEENWDFVSHAIGDELFSFQLRVTGEVLTSDQQREDAFHLLELASGSAAGGIVMMYKNRLLLRKATLMEVSNKPYSKIRDLSKHVLAHEPGHLLYLLDYEGVDAVFDENQQICSVIDAGSFFPIMHNRPFAKVLNIKPCDAGKSLLIKTYLPKYRTEKEQQLYQSVWPLWLETVSKYKKRLPDIEL